MVVLTLAGIGTITRQKQTSELDREILKDEKTMQTLDQERKSLTGKRSRIRMLEELV
jgi:hypothetical protein